MIRHLFVPGLLGPMPGLGRDNRPLLPHLETLLARAHRLVGPVGYAHGLFSAFGVETSADADLPTAAVCFLADTGEVPAGFLMHADPLHLLPDRDRLLAFDLGDDALDADEISRLVEVFNVHFRGEGVCLHGSSSGHLYLHCDRVPSIRTHPLSAVIGRSPDLFLPHGEDRHRWLGLLNEAQMLCYALELNNEREAQGRPTLGGLWFSGGGALPPTGEGRVGRLVGDDLLPRGLHALCAGGGGDEVVVERAPYRAVLHADPGAWSQALAELEGRMPDLLGGCEELHVYPGNGTVYRWTAHASRRFWRRKRSLFECLDVNSTTPGGDKGV